MCSTHKPKIRLGRADNSSDDTDSGMGAERISNGGRA